MQAKSLHLQITGFSQQINPFSQAGRTDGVSRDYVRFLYNCISHIHCINGCILKTMVLCRRRLWVSNLESQQINPFLRTDGRTDSASRDYVLVPNGLHFHQKEAWAASTGAQPTSRRWSKLEYNAGSGRSGHRDHVQ